MTEYNNYTDEQLDKFWETFNKDENKKVLMGYQNSNWQSWHKCIYIKYILKHKNFWWDYYEALKNENISIDDAIKYILPQVIKYANGGNNEEHNPFCYFYEGLSYNLNLTENDLIKYPDGKWNYNSISYNDKISFAFVKNNINHKWNFKELCENMIVNIQNVIDNPTFPWNYNFLVFNKNITIKDILNNPQMFNEKSIRNLNSWQNMTLRRKLGTLNTMEYLEQKYKGITLEDFLDNPTFLWNYPYLAEGKFISLNDLIKHPEILEFKESENLFGYLHITMKDVLDNPNIKWNYKTLSLNSNITFQNVVDNNSLPWDYKNLTKNKNIKLKDVIKNPELGWDFEIILYNRETKLLEQVTVNELYDIENILLKHTKYGKFMIYSLISEYANITYDDYKNYPDFEWDNCSLCKNRNFTYTQIKEISKYTLDMTESYVIDKFMASCK